MAVSLQRRCICFKPDAQSGCQRCARRPREHRV